MVMEVSCLSFPAGALAGMLIILLIGLVLRVQNEQKRLVRLKWRRPKPAVMLFFPAGVVLVSSKLLQGFLFSSKGWYCNKVFQSASLEDSYFYFDWHINTIFLDKSVLSINPRPQSESQFQSLLVFSLSVKCLSLNSMGCPSIPGIHAHLLAVVLLPPAGMLVPPASMVHSEVLQGLQHVSIKVIWEIKVCASGLKKWTPAGHPNSNSIRGPIGWSGERVC